MASSIAQFVVSIGSDGRIASRGTISDALSNNKALLSEVAKEQEEVESEEKIIDEANKKEDTKPSGKLMTKEEIAEGHVSLAAREFFFCCGVLLLVRLNIRHIVKLYLNSMGGPVFWVMFIGGMGLADLANVYVSVSVFIPIPIR